MVDAHPSLAANDAANCETHEQTKPELPINTPGSKLSYYYLHGMCL